MIPNHVHLVLVPSDPEGLGRALARVHEAMPKRPRRDAGAPAIMAGPVGAVAMDEPHLAAARAECRDRDSAHREWPRRPSTSDSKTEGLVIKLAGPSAAGTEQHGWLEII